MDTVNTGPNTSTKSITSSESITTRASLGTAATSSSSSPSAYLTRSFSENDSYISTTSTQYNYDTTELEPIDSLYVQLLAIEWQQKQDDAESWSLDIVDQDFRKFYTQLEDIEKRLEALAGPAECKDVDSENPKSITRAIADKSNHETVDRRDKNVMMSEKILLLESNHMSQTRKNSYTTKNHNDEKPIKTQKSLKFKKKKQFLDPESSLVVQAITPSCSSIMDKPSICHGSPTQSQSQSQKQCWQSDSLDIVPIKSDIVIDLPQKSQTSQSQYTTTSIVPLQRYAITSIRESRDFVVAEVKLETGSELDRIIKELTVLRQGNEKRFNNESDQRSNSSAIVAQQLQQNGQSFKFGNRLNTTPNRQFKKPNHLKFNLNRRHSDPYPNRFSLKDSYNNIDNSTDLMDLNKKKTVSKFDNLNIHFTSPYIPLCRRRRQQQAQPQVQVQVKVQPNEPLYKAKNLLTVNEHSNPGQIVFVTNIQPTKQGQMKILKGAVEKRYRPYIVEQEDHNNRSRISNQQWQIVGVSQTYSGSDKIHMKVDHNVANFKHSVLKLDISPICGNDGHDNESLFNCNTNSAHVQSGSNDDKNHESAKQDYGLLSTPGFQFGYTGGLDISSISEVLPSPINQNCQQTVTSIRSCQQNLDISSMSLINELHDAGITNTGQNANQGLTMGNLTFSNFGLTQNNQQTQWQSSFNQQQENFGITANDHGPSNNSNWYNHNVNEPARKSSTNGNQQQQFGQSDWHCPSYGVTQFSASSIDGDAPGYTVQGSQTSWQNNRNCNSNSQTYQQEKQTQNQCHWPNINCPGPSYGVTQFSGVSIDGDAPGYTVVQESEHYDRCLKKNEADSSMKSRRRSRSRKRKR